jgi:hypothetical protein
MSKGADSKGSVNVFIDTSAHLSFKMYDEVDWRAVLNAERVTIVVLPIVVGELDDKKDSHPAHKIRDRAKSLSRKFNKLFDNHNEAQVREGVIIRYEVIEPAIDYAAKDLNPNRQDDRQLASIITFIEANPGERVMLIARDLNLRTRAKAFGIEAPSLIDELDLPDEPDPKDLEIKELRKRNLELEKQFPKLKLRFKIGSDHVTVTISDFAVLSEDDVSRMIEETRLRFPKMAVKPDDSEQAKVSRPKGPANLSDLAKLFERGVDGYTEIDKRNYNAELDKYFSDLEDYLREHSAYARQECLTAELDIDLVNDGTAPAEDVDIHLHFPDGFELRDEPLDEPSEPKPPRHPLTTLEKLGQDPLRGLSFPHYTPFFSRISGDDPPNVSRPNVRRTKSYSVDIAVGKVKHNTPVLLDRLYLIFESFDTAESFAIEYVIKAGNVPRPVKGYLNVIVRKQDPRQDGSAVETKT